MVGVISSPKEVIEMYGNSKQEMQSNLDLSASKSQQLSLAKSPLQERNSTSPTSPSDSGKPRSSIRPLAGTSQFTSPLRTGERSFITENTSAVSPGNENMPLPTASTGIITKAMEYMFGW